jgi:hypothetical protein
MTKLDELIERHDKLTHALHYNDTGLTRKSKLRYRKLLRSIQRRIYTTKEPVWHSMSWYSDGTCSHHFVKATEPFPNVLPIFYAKPYDTKDQP